MGEGGEAVLYVRNMVIPKQHRNSAQRSTVLGPYIAPASAQTTSDVLHSAGRSDDSMCSSMCMWCPALFLTVTDRRQTPANVSHGARQHRHQTSA